MSPIFLLPTKRIMKKAAATRWRILNHAFELIYAKGFQQASIDDILVTTQVTKGAFYYHFKNKEAMGLAMIRELIQPQMEKWLLHPFAQTQDPLHTLYTVFRGLLLSDPQLLPAQGCPTANLIQELAPTQTTFTSALQTVWATCAEAMTKAIEYGQQTGVVRTNVCAKNIVSFVWAGYWGTRTLAKIQPPTATYNAYLSTLKDYLAQLKP